MLLLTIFIYLTVMCEMLFAYLIVGAIESTPGWMTVDQLIYTDNGSHVETIHVPTDQYLECWDGQAGTAEQNT